MFEEYTKVAIETARRAGRILLEGFGTSFKISSKEGKNNLVTEYDNRSEEFIINNLKKHFPDFSFLAEESGQSNNNKNNGYVWVIDPLDGTVNYAHNLPIFSVSIALIKEKNVLCGVIYNPILDEMFVAEKNKGAYLNDTRLSVSNCDKLDNSFLVTGFPYNIDSNPGHCVDQFVQMLKRGIPVRRLGSAALDLAYVAAGRFDGFWEINLNPWDVAAGFLLVEEAGGVVTQYNLEPYWIFDNNILATNGLIHNELSETLIACYFELNNGT
ncbi:MAG: Inositol-1-monophosphatase [Candidatus Kapaibacterium sp.]|nr:MAG: Inositol-1-monophosphatase [Candidatus Kapabacteria bacterium]